MESVDARALLGGAIEVHLQPNSVTCDGHTFNFFVHQKETKHIRRTPMENVRKLNLIALL